MVMLPALYCCACPEASSQPGRLFRIYEDNDFINIAGRGTDRGYTNGTEFDYFYQQEHRSSFLLDKGFPTAGAVAVNTFGYSVLQVMLVPNDLSRTQPDKRDWPYSGALVLSHSLYSVNPIREWSIQTAWTAGVIGPLSLARQTQTLIHRIIGYTKPMGWHDQMPTDVLLNVSIQAEKMIWQSRRSFECIGGGQVQVGTMVDGVSVHVQFRAGDMTPFFSSYIDRFASAGTGRHRRFQYYFFLMPAVQWWTFNALLEGGIFSGKSRYYAGIDGEGRSPTLKRIAATVDAGIVVVFGRVSLSVTQKEMSPLLHGVVDQTIGNISLTFSW